MSLDWNTKDCPKDGETSGWIEDPVIKGDTPKSFLHEDTNSLVWGAFCGFHIGTITLKNIDEVLWRIAFLKRIDLPWMSDKQFPTVHAVQQHVGLRTNCDTKTRKQWLKFTTEVLSNEVTRTLDLDLNEDAA